MKLTRLLLPLLAAAALALVLAWLDQSPDSGRDWLAYFLVALISGAAVFGVRQVTLGAHWRAALAAGLLRLAVGVALMVLLPVVGYVTSEEHQNGYFYWDALQRDSQSWMVASSPYPLVAETFSGKYWSDQYGGMLLWSAFVYRTFSADFHRPYLLLVLNAAAAICGVLLGGYAVRRWFGPSVAGKAVWIAALYPEAVLLSATHMREAYLIPLVALSLFALARIQEQRRDSWAWIALAGLSMNFLSPLAMVATFTALLLFWLLEPDGRRNWQQLALLALVLLAGLVAVLVAFSSLPSLQGSSPWGMIVAWVQNNITFQSHLLERGSGIVQELQRWVGPQWAWLVTLVYGVAQPVLPAVVGDLDAAWIMRIVGFFRAAGWYALAFFLIYVGVMLAQMPPTPRRRQLIALALLLWAWIAFTALIGGGDQWDNPRYRVFLLPWMALLAAWAWQQALVQRDRWLWRWLSLEAFFVASFTVWYLDRYYIKTIRLGIREMIILNLLAAGIIIGSGLFRRKKANVR